jgi:hypothetical protein
MVELQPFELHVQILVEIVGGLNLPTGHLGCQSNLGPVSAFERLAHKGLAGAIVVWIRGIQVIDAVVNSQ